MDKTKLVDLMASKRMTQSSLAEKAHVSKATLVGIMKHNRVPRMDTLGKIAGALGVKPSELLKT